MRMCIALKDLNIGRANKLADADVLIAECTADQVHKVLTLTAKKRDQHDYKNSDKNRLIKIKVKLEAS